MESRLHLEADPSEVSRARRWVAEQLSTRAAITVETASLLVSELVTNAVLHARSAVDLTLRWAGSEIRIEVEDRSGHVPQAKDYGPEAASGRGLLLVETLSEEWGVDATASGKIVWCRLEDDTGGQEVLILGLDLDVYLEAQEHNDSLMREFALIAESDRSEAIPRRLVEIAREVQDSFGTATTDIRAQIQRAIDDGSRSVDLHMRLPEAAWQQLAGLTRLLDEADVYCEEGNLLTMTSSPRVRRFRRWYSDQVRRQLRGDSPTPWEQAERSGGTPVGR